MAKVELRDPYAYTKTGDLCMSTLVDAAATTRYVRGFIMIRMESGLEIRFPIAANKRLAHGSPKQLNKIEISPYGLHWPDLDEDLSFRGLLAGDFGQHIESRINRCGRRAKARR